MRRVTGALDADGTPFASCRRLDLFSGPEPSPEGWTKAFERFFPELIADRL
jgi:hypothetical protein